MHKLTYGFCLMAYAASIWVVSAAESPKSSKELFDYIQDARKLGLNDDQIRKNAVGAGWDQSAIEQAYSIMRMLNQEKGSKGVFPTPIALPGDYRIGAGDVLQILVWKEPEVSVPATVVRADGKISIPLLKEVDVVGLTVAELEKTLSEKLGKLINSPDVTVVPKEITSRSVYLVGAVRREGPVPLVRPMTVLQALTAGGGVTDYAKRRKIYVLRNQNGKQIRLPFDFQAVLKGEHIEQNIPVLPDDTIVVPQ
jgi:polysaccharide export outer membrane protein